MQRVTAVDDAEAEATPPSLQVDDSIDANQDELFLRDVRFELFS